MGADRSTRRPTARFGSSDPNPAARRSAAGSIIWRARKLGAWLVGGGGLRIRRYTDPRFDAEMPELNHYKALVLNTHPEYWTLQMFDRLEAYLAQGGRLLYLGGNGLYKRVAFIDGARKLLLRDNGINARDLFRSLTPPRPERPILGVAYERRQLERRHIVIPTVSREPGFASFLCGRRRQQRRSDRRLSVVTAPPAVGKWTSRRCCPARTARAPRPQTFRSWRAASTTAR